MTKCIKLAKLNLKNYPKQARTFFVILFVCIMLFLLTVTVSEGFITISNSYKTNDVTLREVEMWQENGEPFNSETCKAVGNLSHVSDISQYYNIELINSYNLTICNTDLNCLPYLRGTNRCFSFAPMSLVLENNKMEYVDPILYGRNFDSDDEKKAIIDEGTCYILGYTDPKEILGEKITLTLSDITITDIEIVGVCSYLYGNYYTDLSRVDEISRQSYLEMALSSPVFFSDDIISDVVKSNDVIDWWYENLRVFVDNTDNVKGVCDKALELYGLSSSNMISAIEAKAESVRSISVILYTISAIILVIVMVSIINTLIIAIEHQKKYTDLILKIGYKKGDIIKVYLFEKLIITLKAGLTAICFSMLMSIGIDVFLSNGYSEVSSQSKYVFLLSVPEAVAIVVIITASIFLVSYIVSSSQINKLGRRM